MERLLRSISQCAVCRGQLPGEPRPILSVATGSRILIIGQAPGRKAHDSEIPWNDASGDELRRWLGVDKPTFYSTRIFGIMPMGFCFPGTGKAGDLPPRKECAPLWHEPLMEKMKRIRLVLLIGGYAQKYYLGGEAGKSVTETVERFESYLPRYLPLVHPSPRNKIWHKLNGWFETRVLPVLRDRVQTIIASK